jgi:hypothetical protein
MRKTVKSQKIRSFVLKYKVLVILLLEILILVSIAFYATVQNTKSETLSIKKLSKDAQDALEIADHCSDIKNLKAGKEVCYTEKFEDFASQRGSKDSFKVFRELQKLDVSTERCHLIAHGIGVGTFRNNGKNWQKEVQTIDVSCNYGALHGVIQSYVSTLPGGKITKEVIPTLCGDKPRGDCNHIVGHLLLVEAKADINQALDYCSVFSNEAQLHYCYAGVFMENQTVDNLIEHGYATQEWKVLSARIDGIEQMCRSFTGTKANACWEEIAYSAFEKYREAEKIFEFCDRSPIDQGALLCKRYSLILITVDRNFDIESIKSICKIPQTRETDFENSCYANLGSSVLVTIPEKADRVVSFCSNLEPDFVQTCLSMIGAVLKERGTVSSSRIKEICQEAKKEYRELCIDGKYSSGTTPLSGEDFRSN